MAAAVAYCKLARIPRTCKVPRGELKMALGDVNTGDLRPSLGKLHKIGTLADADLQDFLPCIRAEVDELAHPGSVVFIAVALDGLKVGKAVFVEAVKCSAWTIGPLLDRGSCRLPSTWFQ